MKIPAKEIPADEVLATDDSVRRVSAVEMLEILADPPPPTDTPLAIRATVEAHEADLENETSLLHRIDSAETGELEKAKSAMDFLGLVREDFDRRDRQQQNTVRFLKSEDTEGSESLTERWSVASETLVTNNIELNNEFEFKRLGRFEIIEAIGQGGFAKVFLARDPQLDRYVALKIPKPQVLFSEEARARFYLEAKSAAVLSHPAIVPVFECGAVGPVTYIANGYCPGQTLGQWFADSDHQVDLQTAAKILIRLADAVQHAHQRGVIHRDLKPMNILVENGKGDIAERVRITDFGLAKQVENDSSITAEGAIVGTPTHMSPEQAVGGVEIGKQTDIYSLGVIFYELLTGQLPFKRSNQLATLRAVESELPAPPRRIDAKISKDFEAICLKCLQKDPGQRYENAYDLARDLEKSLAGQTIIARRTSKFEKIKRWSKRNPGLALSQGFALLFLTIGLSISLYQWQVNQSNLLVSNQQKARAEKNVGRLHETVIRVLDEYHLQLEDGGSLTEMDKKVVTEMLAIHTRLVNEEAEQVTVFEKTLRSYLKIGDLYLEIGEVDFAEKICVQAKKLIEIGAVKNGKGDSGICDIEIELEIMYGVIENTRGRHVLAEAAYLKCIELLKQFDLRFPETDTAYRWMQSQRNLAIAYHGQRKFEESRLAFERGMGIALELVAADPSSEEYQFCLGRAFQDVSNSYRNSGNTTKAIESLEAAKNHFLSMLADESNEEDYRFRVAFIKSDLGSVYHSRKEMELAGQNAREALALFRTLLEESPENALIQHRLVQSLVRLSKYLQDVGEIEEALEVHREGYVVADAVAADYMRLLKQLYFRTHQAILLHEQFDEPELVDSLLDEAIEIGEAGRLLFSNHVHSMSNLTRAYQYKSIIASRDGNEEEADFYATQAADFSVIQLKSRLGSRAAERTAVFYCSYAAHRDGNVGKFEEAQRRLIGLAAVCPESSYLRYEVAKRLAEQVQKQIDRGASDQDIELAQLVATRELKSSIELGFQDGAAVERDSRWDVFRDSPYFQSVAGRISPKIKAAKKEGITPDAAKN